MLSLRRDDRCATCGGELAAGTRAYWDADQRTVTCVGCLLGTSEPTEIERGQPGASAAREYERRKRNREQRVREQHPHIGGALLALNGSPQHELAFDRGSRGEAAVAKTLEARIAGSPTILLHDRRMPGGRGNIDHLAIAPTGVYVIDAKNWSGRVTVVRAPGGERKLMINRSNQTKLIDGLDRQVAAVRTVLASGMPNVPVHGVLCFTEAKLPLLGTLTMRSYPLLYRRALAKRLKAGGPFTREQIVKLAQVLVTAFPPA